MDLKSLSSFYFDLHFKVKKSGDTQSNSTDSNFFPVHIRKSEADDGVLKVNRFSDDVTEDKHSYNLENKSESVCNEITIDKEEANELATYVVDRGLFSPERDKASSISSTHSFTLNCYEDPSSTSGGESLASVKIAKKRRRPQSDDSMEHKKKNKHSKREDSNIVINGSEEMKNNQKKNLKGHKKDRMFIKIPEYPEIVSSDVSSSEFFVSEHIKNRTSSPLEKIDIEYSGKKKHKRKKTAEQIEVSYESEDLTRKKCKKKKKKHSDTEESAKIEDVLLESVESEELLEEKQKKKNKAEIYSSENNLEINGVHKKHKKKKKHQDNDAAKEENVPIECVTEVEDEDIGKKRHKKKRKHKDDDAATKIEDQDSEKKKHKKSKNHKVVEVEKNCEEDIENVFLNGHRKKKKCQQTDQNVKEVIHQEGNNHEIDSDDPQSFLTAFRSGSSSSGTLNATNESLLAILTQKEIEVTTRVESGNEEHIERKKKKHTRHDDKEERKQKKKKHENETRTPLETKHYSMIKKMVKKRVEQIEPYSVDTKRRKSIFTEVNWGRSRRKRDVHEAEDENIDYKEYVKELMEQVTEHDELNLSSQQYRYLKSLSVDMPWPVPPLHLIETRVCSRPTDHQRRSMSELGVSVKNGIFTKVEDDTIRENFSQFCQSHSIPEDATPFLSFKKGKSLTLKQRHRISFVRYLAHGLENRPLYTVYQRFQRLFKTNLKAGRFSPHEDKIILYYMKCEAHKRATPYRDLSKMLNRDNLAVEKRHMKLTAENDSELRWTNDKCLEFIEELTRITGSLVDELKDRQVTTKEWRLLSKKLDNIPYEKLRRAWLCTIYPRLFAEQGLTIDKVKIDLVKKLVHMNYNDWRSIDWDLISKDFEGFTPVRLNKFFKELVSYCVPSDIAPDLQDTLSFLQAEVMPNYNFRSIRVKNLNVV